MPDMAWTQVHKICWRRAGKEEPVGCSFRGFHSTGLVCVAQRQQTWLSSEIIPVQAYTTLCINCILPKDNNSRKLDRFLQSQHCLVFRDTIDQ